MGISFFARGNVEPKADMQEANRAGFSVLRKTFFRGEFIFLKNNWYKKPALSNRKC
jgi:hypothetical protein